MMVNNLLAKAETQALREMEARTLQFYRCHTNSPRVFAPKFTINTSHRLFTIKHTDRDKGRDHSLLQYLIFFLFAGKCRCRYSTRVLALGCWYSVFLNWSMMRQKRRIVSLFSQHGTVSQSAYGLLWHQHAPMRAWLWGGGGRQQQQQLKDSVTQLTNAFDN